MEEDALERRERSRQEEEAEKMAVAEVEAFMKGKQRNQLETIRDVGGTSHPFSLEEDHSSLDEGGASHPSIQTK